jgi:peptidoglycan DL-endopeptidase CwlO
VRRTSFRRSSGVRPVVTLLALAVTLVVGAAPPAAAAPGVAAALPAAAPKPAPEEGGTKKLRDALEASAKGHIQAKNRLETSKARQAALVTEVKELELLQVQLSAQVGEVAAESYQIGRLTPFSMLLNSASPEDLLERAAGLDMMAQRDAKRLRSLIEARQRADQARRAIDAEVGEQAKQVAQMAAKKRDAERALAAVSTGASGGFAGGGSASARPAPRNSDGSWPDESCSADDPTTSGCITPRTLHALNQGQAAGYKRHVSCFRSGGNGEHPKGQACDFSAAAGGFKDETATGGDRSYGNNVAAYYVRNAGRLGVLYVIWYRQIWHPGTGWRAYGGSGSPAADHTNHVHLSMY